MFSTESKYGDLLVLSLPAEAPTIQGEESHYAPGDFLHLNCSSYESKPAADLSWYVNDQKVERLETPDCHQVFDTTVIPQADGSYVIPHPITLNNKTGLYTARSELFMTLGRTHFNQTGQISVRCEASIGSNNKNTDTTIFSK